MPVESDISQGSPPLNHPAVENELLTRMNEVTAFAGYLCRDEHATKDLVQDTMFKALTNVASYTTGSNARAWLFQICKNTFINSTRRKRFEGNRFEGTQLDDAGEDEYSCALMGDAHADAFGDEVMIALKSIPTDCQTAILLCDVEGYSYDEIAVLTKTRPGTVRSRIFRGRRALAGLLAGYAANLRLTSSSLPSVD
jgi:RNA polymerase sigma-70 factor (ECF subfamily)